MKHQPVELAVTQPSDRMVKSGALMLFRAVRAVTDQAKKAPGVLAQAAADVKDAWRESSCPNA